jgi:hypothetical protein
MCTQVHEWWCGSTKPCPARAAASTTPSPAAFTTAVAITIAEHALREWQKGSMWGLRTVRARQLGLHAHVQRLVALSD